MSRLAVVLKVYCAFTGIWTFEFLTQSQPVVWYSNSQSGSQAVGRQSKFIVKVNIDFESNE